MNKFLIASTLRSGAGLLSDYLNSSKILGVVSNAEAFRKTLSNQSTKRFIGLKKPVDDILKITDNFNSYSKDNYGVVVNGSTILNTDITDQFNIEDDNLVYERLIQKHVLGSFDKVILVQRDNKLEQAINTYYASITGKWMDTSDNTVEEDKILAMIGINPLRFRKRFNTPKYLQDLAINNPANKIDYNFMEIYSNLTRIYSEEDNWNAYLKLNNIQFLTVTYEDLLANRDTVLSSVFNYLGASTEGLDFSSYKTRKKVINPDLEDFTTRFKADYQTAFGKQYRNTRFTI